MNATMHEWRIAAARRLLREHGFGDLAPMVDRGPSVEPPAVAEREPAPAKTPDPALALLDEPEAFHLAVVDGRVRGPDGWTKLTRGLSLLFKGLQADGAAVRHGYTPGSCERTLRGARRSLAEVAPKLADLILSPVAHEGTVRVCTRRPVRLVIVDQVTTEVLGSKPEWWNPPQDLHGRRRVIAPGAR